VRVSATQIGRHIGRVVLDGDVDFRVLVQRTQTLSGAEGVQLFEG